MITKFKVERFKSIESAELELGNVNVFIGANGSGKSNLLEALGVMAAAAAGRVDEESLMRRGCRPGGFLKPMFRDSPEDATTHLEAANGSQTYATDLVSPPLGRLVGWEFRQEIVTIEGTELLNRGKEKSKGDSQAGLAALKLADGGFSERAADFLKTISAYGIYSADTLVMRGQIQDLQPREPMGLSGGRLVQAVDEMGAEDAIRGRLTKEFQRAFEHFARFYVGSRQALPKEENARQDLLAFVDRHFRLNPQGGPYIMEPYQVNEGALFFLFVAVLCLHSASPRLLAIDNADHGLNPLLAKRLMMDVCEWHTEKGDRQILMTTHNPLVLDGLSLEDDRVRLFTVDRDNLGKTIVKRFMVTKEHLQKAAEGWTLSRMWVNGLIGGVPNV